MTTPSPFGPTDPTTSRWRHRRPWRRISPASGCVVSVPPRRSPVVPDGCTDLMWMSDDAEARLVVAGPDTRPYPTRLRPGTHDRRRPVPARRGADVLGVPLDALRDERPELADLWGRGRRRPPGRRRRRGRSTRAVLAAAVAGVCIAGARPRPGDAPRGDRARPDGRAHRPCGRWPTSIGPVRAPAPPAVPRRLRLRAEDAAPGAAVPGGAASGPGRATTWPGSPTSAATPTRRTWPATCPP